MQKRFNNTQNHIQTNQFNQNMNLEHLILKRKLEKFTWIHNSEFDSTNL